MMRTFIGNGNPRTFAMGAASGILSALFELHNNQDPEKMRAEHLAVMIGGGLAVALLSLCSDNALSRKAASSYLGHYCGYTGCLMLSSVIELRPSQNRIRMR